MGGWGGGARHTLAIAIAIAIAIGLGLAMSTSRVISLATSCYLFCMCCCTCELYIVHQRTVMLMAAGRDRLITGHGLYWTSAQAQRNYLGQFQSLLRTLPCLFQVSFQLPRSRSRCMPSTIRLRSSEASRIRSCLHNRHSISPSTGSGCN